MAKDKELYWIGPGTVLINKKPWDVEKPLPDSLSKEFIQRNIDLKNIGEKIGTAEMITESAKEELKLLKDELKKANKNVELLKGVNADLTAEVELLKEELAISEEEEDPKNKKDKK